MIQDDSDHVHDESLTHVDESVPSIHVSWITDPDHPKEMHPWLLLLLQK